MRAMVFGLGGDFFLYPRRTQVIFFFPGITYMPGDTLNPLFG